LTTQIIMITKRTFPPLYKPTGDVDVNRLAFFHVLERLKTQKRTGWIDFNVRNLGLTRSWLNLLLGFQIRRGTPRSVPYRPLAYIPIPQHLGPHVPHGGAGHVYIQLDA